MVYAYLLFGSLLACVITWGMTYSYQDKKQYSFQGIKDERWSSVGYTGWTPGSFPMIPDSVPEQWSGALPSLSVEGGAGQTTVAPTKSPEQAFFEGFPFGEEIGENDRFLGWYPNAIGAWADEGTETDYDQGTTSRYDAHLKPPPGGWGVDYEAYDYHPG